LAVVLAQSTTQADGIRDYTFRLLREIERHPDWELSLAVRSLDGRWQTFGSDPSANGGPSRRHAVPRCVAAADAVVLQYNPFSYGRRGFAPSLLAEVARLRLQPGRPTMALMVHETYVTMKNWRWALMGSWQRVQLRVLGALTDLQFCAIEAWIERLGRGGRGRSVHHLPVGSNFPDRRGHRDSERLRLGADHDTVVLACFGMSHPGRLEAHVMQAAESVARSGRRVILLNLGTDPCRRRNGDSFSVHSPGYLDEEPVARLLSAADIFLAPYGDGVSTRRTTVMAALQHELPVVGTVGPLTDDVLRGSAALRLIPLDRPELFSGAVSELATDAAERRALGRAGRELYESRFDWPVLVRRLLDVLAATAERR
jgi:glycosyltransferase involved in cell wall biosynthesis